MLLGHVPEQYYKLLLLKTITPIILVGIKLRYAFSYYLHLNLIMLETN
jgi:hypothetical protein